VRILLDATGEVGRRTGRILLSEPATEYIGLWRDSGATSRKRSGPVDDATGFDVVVTDREQQIGDLVARASVEGIPFVSWADSDEVPRGRTAAPVVTGANVGSALPVSLLAHPAASPREGEEVTLGWTEPGRPLRRGHALAFPEPVGMAWTKQRSPGRMVAYRDDEWGGATTLIESGDASRVVGVADLSAHLEALVLAATVLVAAAGDYPSSVSTAGDRPDALLDRLTHLELDIAVWRSST
jgi:hypothetical protein